jgi:hypothetical protein
MYVDLKIEKQSNKLRARQLQLRKQTDPSTMMRERKTRRPVSLGQGSSAVAMHERKKANRLTPTKLLLRIVGVVLLIYFAMTLAIIHSDTNVNADVLDTESLYVPQKQKQKQKQKVGNINVDKNHGGDAKSKNIIKGTRIGTPRTSTSNSEKTSESYELTAFIEPINQEEWKIKPLPVRNSTSSQLKKETYGKIACSKLPELWPTSEEAAPTNKDPFLPWIHDVFPSADGKFIQFVAQNKRRCQSGTLFGAVKKFFQPNIALFQHVPVSRVTTANSGDLRYRISSHEEADEDAVETRFICRFKPSMEETLSVHNLNYDYHTMRKAYKATFTEEGFDNHMIWSSQLLFKCPVPESLQEKVRQGLTVDQNDFATEFVDLVPIRTPPRYGAPTTYLPPRRFSKENTWDPKVEWGEDHILPRIQDSGRWENIPICKRKSVCIECVPLRFYA